MKQFHIALNDELYRKIVNKSKELNVSVSALIRIALIEFLKKGN